MSQSQRSPFQRLEIVETKLLRVACSGHFSFPHVDPSEEQWDGYSMVFTETGRWSYRDRNGSAKISPRMIVLGSPCQYYACRHEEEIPEDRCLDVRFQESMLRDLPLLDNASSFRYSIMRATPRLIMLKERIKRAVHGCSDEMDIEEAGQELLQELARAFERGSVGAPLPLDRRHGESVEAAREFIERHFAEKLRLNDLASSVGLSLFHFTRLFRSHTGRSPYGYLRDFRLDQASRLLHQGDRSVTELAYDVGFDNLSLFINAFRSRFGVSPSRFRRNSALHSAR